VASCPNCNAAIAIDAPSCVRCEADFGPNAQWRPLPQDGEEFAVDAQRGEAAPKVPAAQVEAGQVFICGFFILLALMAAGSFCVLASRAASPWAAALWWGLAACSGLAAPVLIVRYYDNLVLLAFAAMVVGGLALSVSRAKQGDLIHMAVTCAVLGIPAAGFERARRRLRGALRFVVLTGLTAMFFVGWTMAMEREVLAGLWLALLVGLFFLGMATGHVRSVRGPLPPYDPARGRARLRKAFGHPIAIAGALLAMGVLYARARWL
jgi:hypothetical protein